MRNKSAFFQTFRYFALVAAGMLDCASASLVRAALCTRWSYDCKHSILRAACIFHSASTLPVAIFRHKSIRHSVSSLYRYATFKSSLLAVSLFSSILVWQKEHLWLHGKATLAERKLASRNAFIMRFCSYTVQPETH